MARSSLSINESERASLVSDVGLDNFSRQRPGSSQTFSYTKTSTITRETSVITEQPTQSRTLTFDVTKFDSLSSQLYNGLSVVHKAPGKVMAEVHTTGRQLAQQVSNTQANLQDFITYDELLRTLVHDNETILTHGWRLTYREALFVNCEGPSALDMDVVNPADIVQKMPAGSAILTDQRLLLMSAQLHAGFQLSTVGTGKPRRYTLAACVSDNLHFKPIPLDSFRSVELSASMGSAASAQIFALDPCCRGLFKCCGCCCVKAGKRWTHNSKGSLTVHNKRTIKLGLLLPPWGRKCMLYLELEPDMSLSLARDFIAILQKHRRLAA